MAKVIDSLECGKCGEIFHQLEVFIKHKMSNCTAKEDEEEDSDTKTKKPVKKSEGSMKGVSRMSKGIEKAKNMNRVSPKFLPKKSKLMMLESESPKLKGVTGYLWKKRLLQEQQKQLMRAKRKSMMSEEEPFDPVGDSSDSDSSLIGERCGQCSGCLMEEDCMECEVCLRKMEDPDVDDLCIMRECTAEADGEVYKVEKIVAKRFRHGRFEYLIKWKGYSSAENTWEPKENILSPALLEDFERRQRMMSKRSPQNMHGMPRKRKKFYYTESSDDSSHDETRASRMFSPATALDAQRGRSSKKAAMNFIKTVCKKGRRPSPEVLHVPTLSSDSESRSPSPELSKKKIIIEVPDPKEKGKYIRVKGEARKIKFLKDCDLQPVVDLGKPVPNNDEDIQALVFEDIVQRRVAKLREKEMQKRIGEAKQKPTGLHKARGNEFSPKIVTPVKTISSKVGETKFGKLLEYGAEKKKRIGYQQKIESLMEKNAEDMETTLDDFDDSGDFKTLAELRESLRQNAKKEEKTIAKPKVSSPTPKAGARKNFPRPLKPKGALSTQPSTQNIGGVSNPVVGVKGKDSTNERVFVVMPDGSMVEVSTAKTDSNVPKAPVETTQKKILPKEKTKAVSKSVIPLSKKTSSQVTLEDCTGDAIDDSKTLKLPNTLQLVQSELPLSEAENNSKLIGMFLFRQVISPNDPSQKCLLCPNKNTFRELVDLEKHYSQVHELASQTFKAEFSENIVFVCVPPDVTESTTLNSICRFCDITLKNLSEVRSHYPTSHNKVVRLVQEREVTELSSSLFCSICSEMSKDFTEHHAHMKAVHRMQTYVCKYCNFVTSRANRLKSHVKQKHISGGVDLTPTILGAKGSKIKLKCPVCHLFINGKVNLDQHILLAHSVQTGPETWSCAKCLKPCGSAKDFTVHVFSCTSNRGGDRNIQYKPTFVKQTTCIYKCNQCSATYISEKLIKKHLSESKHSQGFEVVRQVEADEGPKQNCFLCDKTFPSPKLYEKHLVHVHMEWVERKGVEHNDGTNPDDVINTSLQMEEVPTQEELADISFPSKIGHYCHICDTVIASYPLYYLHMQDLHVTEKCFRCVITSCRKTFTSPSEFEQHIQSHPQDMVHNCSICDATFVDQEELKEHNLSVEHGSRYMKMHEKCRPSGIEARNYQCKVCQTWFGLRHYLIQHMETDNHDYKCQKCGLQYLQPGSRRLHIQQVHPDIATTCEFCGLKMQSTQAVWGHLKTHGIVHECQSCHRRFLHKEQVNTHMETHDPPVQCPWEGCSRHLVTKISLYFHLKTHRGDEDHKCPYCQKGFMKEKLLEAHIKTHETEVSKTEETEAKVASAAVAMDESNEAELIQLICAGCDQGFDDEDQFAGHDCKVSKQSSITDIVPNQKYSSNKEENERPSGNEDPKNSDNDLLSSVLENTDDLQLLQEEGTLKSDECKPLEVSSENNQDISEKNLQLETEVSNGSDERKDFIDGVLSISNQESNDASSAQFDDLSNEMVLALEKNEVMTLEDSESADHQADLSQDFSLDSDGKPEDEQNLSSSMQEETTDVLDSENKLADKYMEVPADEEFPTTAESVEQETMSEDRDAKEADIESETEHRTVMMVVSDHQDEGQEMELELPDDPSYAGATLLKVPTSDGKQVLLIPFSSADGTVSLQLPPGMTLEGADGTHGQNIQVALEGAGTIDENGVGTEPRYLHVPVEGEVINELLQNEQDMQVHEKLTADSIVSENSISSL
ncbi:uncharacterized protein LOC129959791 [Argiope bruennichi]|uniref:uncharacterized protein LOC129959791 n=1 Tax=Argiope bruennichi TaxID=94029 RepID=UPI00249434F1|nr:uncharacterized protein LOC129959791 [Argiope bruennichi]XP_055928734.1 uncharacterized protein LOC129959791 [Argiope bruennichi]